jgi:hypothetical protein
MPQYPMSFNYPGPFNLFGTPGQQFSLEADDGGRVAIVPASGGGGGVPLPSVANGIVFATDTNGDLDTTANGTLDSDGNLVVAGSLSAGANGLTVDPSGNVVAASVSTVDVTITAGGNASGDDWVIESNGSVGFDNGFFTSDGSGNVTAVSLTTSSPGQTLFVPSGTSDPGAPTAGQIWVNGTALKFCDNTGTVRTVTST